MNQNQNKKDIIEDKYIIDELFKILDDLGVDLTLFFRNLPLVLQGEEKQNDFINKMLRYSLSLYLKIEKTKPKMNESTLQSLKAIKETNPMILYSYGIDPEFVEGEIKKSQKYNQLKFEKSYTNEKFKEDKKFRLLEWIMMYKSRVTKENEKIKNLSAIELKESMEHLFNEEFMFKYPLSNNSFNNIPFKLSQKVLSELENKIKSLSTLSEIDDYRIEQMNSLNPKFILRNHILQKVIEKAEGGNYNQLKKIFEIMMSPFDEHSDEQFDSHYDTSELLAYNICVSCSS